MADVRMNPGSSLSSAQERGKFLIRSSASTRATSTSAGSESVSIPAMTSGCDFPLSAPPFISRSSRNIFYKVLCFILIVIQGGIIDFYLIVFNNLYWCSWIATDLVVVSGWAMFFVRNSRSKRERACGFRQRSSLFGCHLDEFAFAHLAWLVYVIAYVPRMALVLQTSVLDQVANDVPYGSTGFEVTSLLGAPLLFCLINSLVEDPHGAPRYYSHSCFVSTCVDILDSFTLVELLNIKNEIQNEFLEYSVMAVYFVALVVPVLWLYELSAASRMHCGWMCSRFFSAILLDAPLLTIRCLLMHLYDMPVSLFMFKNVFFLTFKFLELVKQRMSMRSSRRLTHGGDQIQFSSLAINTQH